MKPPLEKKRAPLPPPAQDTKHVPPRSEVRTAVQMPGTTLTSKLIRPHRSAE